MPFDDQNVDVGGVDDRRGRGGGGFGMPMAVGGGGAGIIGLLLFLAVNLLGGGDLSSLASGDVTTSGAPESSEALRARCNTDGAIDRYDDCYVIKSYNEINEVWTEIFRQRGDTYRQPKLVFFEQAVQTSCGNASSQVGPFYCPQDEGIYLDLGFLAALQQRFGADGRYAQTYIVAHEVGHHLQTLYGTERQVQSASRDASRQRALSIATELQADCYAGVWSTVANRAGNFSITERELDEALNAAAAVGDDRIQQKTQGRVDPESWTHGSAEQRRQWFLNGYRAAQPEACDTFRGI